MCEKVIKSVLGKFVNFQTAPPLPAFESTRTGIKMTTLKCSTLKTKKTSNKRKTNQYKNVQLRGLGKFKTGIIIVSFRKNRSTPSSSCRLLYLSP